MSNRLANETSPYLLQHAHNPVHWWPWCEEAFEQARQLELPVFLSIGYSACHWCHVMERESFENTRIAEILNSRFVSIKVDREERPDIDQVYMQAVMALLGGHGGWPLSAFLTPDQHVFYGGTYWPPDSRMGQPGFSHVLERVHDAWVNRREQILAQSRQVTGWIEQHQRQGDSQDNGTALDQALLGQAVERLVAEYDGENGGFGSAPKFPHSMVLEFLLRLATDPGFECNVPRSSMMEMVRGNLDGMANGGIYDHLGGGFARYSVDPMWLVPHFEKMLYDNALLTGVYQAGARQTGNVRWADVVRDTVGYLMRDMLDPGGAIHSAEDADSEGEEGKFYVWSRAEVESVLGADRAQRFCAAFDVSTGGNFEGHNIPNLLQQSLADTAGALHIFLPDLKEELARSKAELLAHRAKRIRPAKDDKILASWNALAISALSRAAVSLDEPEYTAAAMRIAGFIRDNMVRKDGRLMHSWRNGRAGHQAFLDDYGYLAVALTDLYQATQEQSLVDWAVELVREMIALFSDQEQGPMFFSGNDVDPLIARMQDQHDSSVPSGNSMAAMALLRLGTMTGNTAWIDRARSIAMASAGLLARAPVAAGQIGCVIAELVLDPPHYALVTPDMASRDATLGIIRASQAPALFIATHISGEAVSPNLAELFRDRTAIDNQSTLYVCRSQSCEPPLVGAQAIQEYLNSRVRNSNDRPLG